MAEEKTLRFGSCCIVNAVRWIIAVMLMTSAATTALSSATSGVAGEPGLAERYRLAESVLAWHIEGLLYGVPTHHQWMDGGSRLDYGVRTADGERFFSVDARTGMKRPTRPPAGVHAVAEDLLVSPDGCWGLRIREGNLFRISMQDGVETPLTHDGEPDFAYAATPDSDLFSVTRAIHGTVLPPVGVWSPDSGNFLTYRVDQRRVRVLPLVQSIVPAAEHQIPRLHQQHVALPGDEHVTLAHFMVFDVAAGTSVALDVPAGILADSGPPAVTNLRWSADSQRAYVLHEARGYRTLGFHEADPRTGRSHLLVSESAALPLRTPTSESGPGYFIAWPMQSNRDVLFHSERDGWGHLYLYDGRDASLRHQITRGKWSVQAVLHVDEAHRWIYFLANGKESGDPYFSYLYRVRFDGSKLSLLTPEPAHHTVTFAPDGRAFLDMHSTVDRAPVTVLRAPDGRFIAELERGDASALLAAGWRPPERFRVLAADGETALYGTLHRPSHFDPGRRYPFVDSIYHGSHTPTAAFSFDLSGDSRLAQPTAELGFIVMVLDARGTSMRGQAFQDFSYGSGFGSPDAMADHIAAARQLAARDPAIDLDRVGIYGHSWGGYRAARAMFQFPEFYKVGVASSGSHDNFLYVNSHELWFGMPPQADAIYREQSNLPLANQLQGKLLLVHGEVDDSVHPANTLQLASALIDANKNFDLLILPGRSHDIWSDPYFVRRRWDYLVQHLMGITPPTGFAVRGPAD